MKIEIDPDELIVKYRKLQEGHRADSGYNRGVRDCIRVILEEMEDDTCGCNGCEG